MGIGVWVWVRIGQNGQFRYGYHYEYESVFCDDSPGGSGTVLPGEEAQEDGLGVVRVGIGIDEVAEFEGKEGWG